MAIYYDGFDWDIDGFPGEYVYGDYEYVDDYYKDERWKPVWDIPGYWISTKARVWSALSMSFIEGTPLRSGHIDMSLKCEGRRVHRYLHRLVAEAFIPNPHGYPEVRHLNDDPSDNEIDNLAWGTQYDNVQDSIQNGHFYYLSRDDIERANAVRRVPIVAVRLKDDKKLYFSSQCEASRQLGIDQVSIADVVNKRHRSAGGYYFARQDGFDESFDYAAHKYQRKGVPVKAININTGETLVFDKPRHAAFNLNISEASVSNILHGKSLSAKGWTFRYVEEDCDDDVY